MGPTRTECLLALLAALCCGGARAHSGGGEVGCWATLDTLRYEVSAWQPASGDGQLYCGRLPARGRTVLAFDAIDPELARLPVELALWRADDVRGYAASLWQDAAAAARRVAWLPATVRADGTLVVDVTLAQPGDYVAALRARRADGSELLGEFRFEVGGAEFVQRATLGIALGLPALLALVLGIEARRRAARA